MIEESQPHQKECLRIKDGWLQKQVTFTVGSLKAKSIIYIILAYLLEQLNVSFSLWLYFVQQYWYKHLGKRKLFAKVVHQIAHPLPVVHELNNNELTMSYLRGQSILNDLHK